jgi:hypothetical protein
MSHGLLPRDGGLSQFRSSLQSAASPPGQASHNTGVKRALLERIMTELPGQASSSESSRAEIPREK